MFSLAHLHCSLEFIIDFEFLIPFNGILKLETLRQRWYSGRHLAWFDHSIKVSHFGVLWAEECLLSNHGLILRAFHSWFVVVLWARVLILDYLAIAWLVQNLDDVWCISICRRLDVDDVEDAWTLRVWNFDILPTLLNSIHVVMGNRLRLLGGIILLVVSVNLHTLVSDLGLIGSHRRHLCIWLGLNSQPLVVAGLG